MPKTNTDNLPTDQGQADSEIDPPSPAGEQEQTTSSPLRHIENAQHSQRPGHGTGGTPVEAALSPLVLRGANLEHTSNEPIESIPTVPEKFVVANSKEGGDPQAPSNGKQQHTSKHVASKVDKGESVSKPKSEKARATDQSATTPSGSGKLKEAKEDASSVKLENASPIGQGASSSSSRKSGEVQGPVSVVKPRQSNTRVLESVSSPTDGIHRRPNDTASGERRIATGVVISTSAAISGAVATTSTRGATTVTATTNAGSTVVCTTTSSTDVSSTTTIASVVNNEAASGRMEKRTKKIASDKTESSQKNVIDASTVRKRVGQRVQEAEDRTKKPEEKSKRLEREFKKLEERVEKPERNTEEAERNTEEAKRKSKKLEEQVKTLKKQVKELNARAEEAEKRAETAEKRAKDAKKIVEDAKKKVKNAEKRAKAAEEEAAAASKSAWNTEKKKKLAAYRREKYIKPIPSPYLRYMVIFDKFQEGDAKHADLHHDRVENLTKKFDRRYKKEETNPTFCQFYKENGKACGESQTNISYEGFQIRACFSHFREVREHGGLDGVTYLSDDRFKIYMSPDIFVSELTHKKHLHAGLRYKNLDYSKVRKAMMKEKYADMKGQLYINIGNGKGPFINKDDKSPNVNVGVTDNMHRRSDQKRNETGSKIGPGTRYFGEFMERGRVESLFHGLLKGQGFKKSATHNGQNKREFYNMDPEQASNKFLDIVLPYLQIYRPDMLVNYTKKKQIFC
ncbi:hypothetical protein BG004_004196 [Podila humilis]|nr:hypothetical protein BG004_004196 [Podila humilis]